MTVTADKHTDDEKTEIVDDAIGLEETADEIVEPETETEAEPESDATAEADDDTAEVEPEGATRGRRRRGQAVAHPHRNAHVQDQRVRHALEGAEHHRHAVAFAGQLDDGALCVGGIAQPLAA